MCVTLMCMNDLLLPNPSLDSSLAQYVITLEHLRDRPLSGSTPAWLFFDLKDIMHQLESLTSARIEGNRTTIMNVVENVIEGKQETKDESVKELININEAIHYIEENIQTKKINHSFIKDLHKIVVKDLVNDGSRSPGVYRAEDVSIQNSEVNLPSYLRVKELMDELVDFINQESSPQFDLIKTAVAHHRFTAIHPFDNGNGRTVRLITYAMLTRQKFIDENGHRLLNPSAIFCMDRQKYYDMLSTADAGGEKNIMRWCEYVLKGIEDEIGKIDKLLDKNFAVDNIIIPSLKIALDKKQITQTEYDILRIAASKSAFQVKDVQHLFGVTPSDRVKASRAVQKLRAEGFVMVQPGTKQKYVLRFSNNYLLRGVIIQLDAYNLLPISPNS
jgi:Fic family protein